MLKESVDEEQFMSESIESLKIDSNDEQLCIKNINRKSNNDLLEELMNDEELKWKKGQWFTSRKIDKLNLLMAKYSGNQKSIWNYLKFSKSSNYRILKENSSNQFNSRYTRREERSIKEIPLLDQVYIAKIIEPPTEPISIKEI